MTEQYLREGVVVTAVSWLGLKESDGGHKKIIDTYNGHKPLARGYKVKYTDPWCATYVSAVSISCGLTDILPTECSCSKMINLFNKLGSWVESDAYTPKPADVCFYDWDDSGKGDNTGHSEHVGLVEKVEGDTIYVIEGNYSNSVKRRKIKVNGRYIRGYGTPNYASKADQAAVPSTPDTPVKDESIAKEVQINFPTLREGSEGQAVKSMQILLIGYGYDCGEHGDDGEYGKDTRAAVERYQYAKGLEVDGEAGPDTLSSLYGLR